MMFFYTWDLNCDWFSFAVNIFDSEWLFEIIAQYSFGSTHSAMLFLSNLVFIIFSFIVAQAFLIDAERYFMQSWLK